MALDGGQIAIGVGTTIGTVVTTVMVGWPRIKKALAAGASEGAANTLNGTAEAVRDIRRMLGDHIADTYKRFDRSDARFDEMGDALAQTREDVAHLRGRYGEAPPKRTKTPAKMTPRRR